MKKLVRVNLIDLGIRANSLEADLAKKFNEVIDKINEIVEILNYDEKDSK